MYNFIMILMYAVEQQRDKEQNRKQGSKSKQQLANERIGDLNALLGEDSSSTPKEQGVVTIEITPEDMKKAKKEKETRQQQIKERRFSLPSRTKTRSSGK